MEKEKTYKHITDMQDCKQQIIDMINMVNDPWVLDLIYKCVVNATKED